MTEHYVPSSPPCPFCGELLDGATGLTGPNAPEDYDVAVCLYCAEPSIFEKGMLREPTAAETEAIVEEPGYRLAMAIAIKFVAERNQEES